MNIKIKTTVRVPEIPTEVEVEMGTLRDLLAEIFKNVHFANEIRNPKTGEISFDGIFGVALNGTPYYSLPQGLDAELHDGDTVTLSIIMLGGG